METKSYLVIARKYRPRTFDEVAGQDPVARTLKNAVTMNRVGQAYLFAGPRGVGKTSMARIFAKALNCKKGPTPTPCGECQPCVEIEGARSLDVMEIDGASNRGIDEIRALRENVKFAPASGKFKVYIIDEAHQITTDGFNALLKTLEEPPAHVKFIFATTAAQKMPATILSRCQRFDFRRITTAQIAATLKEICKKEAIKIDDAALFVVAKAADGSLRDAQSILDQVAACSEGKISARDVTGALGFLEEETLIEITSALGRGDAKSALCLLHALLEEGKDPAVFLEKLLEHTRNLLFVKESKELAELVDAGEAYKAALDGQKDVFSREDLFYFFSVITHALSVMRRFESKRIPLEMALIKLAQRTPLESIAGILERLNDVEKKTPVVVSVPRPAAKPNPGGDDTDDAPDPDVEELPAGELKVSGSLEEKKSVALESVWQPLLRALKAEKISVASYLAEGEPAELKAGVVKILFPEKFNFHRECLEGTDNKKLIEKHLSSFLEQSVRIEFETVKDLSGPSAAAGGGEAGGEPAEWVKSAMNLFGGRIVSE